MTKSMRLKWEPLNQAPHELIQERFLEYTNRKKQFVLMENGTVLFLNDYCGVDSIVAECMENLKFIPDFSVQEMTHKDFLVDIASAAFVYVGKDEFENARHEVLERRGELQFSGESFLGEKNQEHLLVGLYARAKMYRDAFTKKIHSIVKPQC